jgi:hypothetical protein
MVVEPDVDVGVVDVGDNIVAAPAATTHRTETPAPNMEPVTLIAIFATPAINPL